MKRMVICSVSLALLTFSVAPQAELALGVDLTTTLTHERDIDENQNANQTTKTTDFRFDIWPQVIIAPSDRFEIVPFAGVRFTRSHEVTELADGTEQSLDPVVDVGFGAGCGLYLRVINNKPFRLSLGPDARLDFLNPEGDDNSNIGVSLGLPVHLDLLIAKRVFVRLSTRLVVMGYERNWVNQNHAIDTWTFFDINTVQQPRLGFYLTF
jgi:hypothetical protein